MKRNPNTIAWLQTLGVFVLVSFVTMPHVVLLPLAAQDGLGVVCSALGLSFGVLLVGALAGTLCCYVIAPLTIGFAHDLTDSPESLKQTAAELSRGVGLRAAPRLTVLRTPETNAMAFLDPLGPRLCVTSGLVAAFQHGHLSKADIRAVLAHEIGHLQLSDPLRSSLAFSWVAMIDTLGAIQLVLGQALCTVGGVLSDCDDQATIRKVGEGTYVARKDLGGPVAETGCFLVFLGLMFCLYGATCQLLAKLVSLIPLWHLRAMELRADTTAARLTSPVQVQKALTKIHQMNEMIAQQELRPLPFPDRWHTPPCKRSWIDQLWSTHPSFEKRMSQLNALEEPSVQTG